MIVASDVIWRKIAAAAEKHVLANPGMSSVSAAIAVPASQVSIASDAASAERRRRQAAMEAAAASTRPPDATKQASADKTTRESVPVAGDRAEDDADSPPPVEYEDDREYEPEM